MHAARGGHLCGVPGCSASGRTAAVSLCLWCGRDDGAGSGDIRLSGVLMIDLGYGTGIEGDLAVILLVPESEDVGSECLVDHIHEKRGDNTLIKMNCSTSMSRKVDSYCNEKPALCNASYSLYKKGFFVIA